MKQCNFCKEEIEEREEILIQGKSFHNYLIDCLAAATNLKDFDKIEYLCEGCKEPISSITGFFITKDKKFVHNYDPDCIIKYINNQKREIMVDREIFYGNIKPEVPVICFNCFEPCHPVWYDKYKEWLSDCCEKEMTERMFCTLCKEEFMDFPEEYEGQAICNTCFENLEKKE